MKKYLSFLLIFILLVVLAVEISGISVSFNPNPQVTPLNQNFTNILRVDNPFVLHGYSLSIHYDSTKLNFVSASYGSLFNGQNIFWWRVITDTLNVIVIDCIITGQAHVDGPGNILNLIFNPISGNFTQLSVGWIRLYDMSGGYIWDVERSPGDIIIGSQVIYAKIKCWLQGPYSDGLMQTNLANMLPLTSPYSADPVSVNSIPENVVDWVLLELRSSATGPPIRSKSMWLTKDGYIHTPGISIVALLNSSPGSYYVVLRHRNHLAIMSGSAVQFISTGTPPLLDLTNSSNIYGGMTGVITVSANNVAMIAGDADQNGSIGPSDRNGAWRNQVGLGGYLSADFNLDGSVFPSDLNNCWRVNSGRASMVPISQ